MNYWRIEMWRDSEDRAPKIERDLLKNLKKKDPQAYESLGEQMIRYVEVPIENIKQQRELKKMTGEVNMWELRFHLIRNEIRFLGCLTIEEEGEVYYALYGFVKKEQKVRGQDILTTRGRIQEFKVCYNENGSKKIL